MTNENPSQTIGDLVCQMVFDEGKEDLRLKGQTLEIQKQEYLSMKTFVCFEDCDWCKRKKTVPVLKDGDEEYAIECLWCT